MVIAGGSSVIGYLGQNRVLVGREPSPSELTPSQQELTDTLKQRDREVKSHELAHLNAVGDLAVSGPKYNYQTGPDGKVYAIGGEVTLALKPSSDPQTTIEDARRLKAAALAVKDPSGADLAAAGVANQVESEVNSNRPGKLIDTWA